MINRLNRFDFNRVFPRPISSGGGVAPAVNPLHSIGALTRISRGERPIAAANGTYGPYEVVGGLLRPRVSPVTPGFY
ncbi:hypothetical protein, partial [Lactococcus petauri]|uniref:hypothetical protein n=1 Tax=Lactococcus petauri TaxID=1940789 RepID=UPI0021F2445D